MFVVAGVTGHTGQAAANRLLELGKPVRVIVRKPEQAAAWTARGAEVAVASLDDAAATAAALKGASGAYLLVPPRYTSDRFAEAQRGTVDAIADAVRASGIGHVALLSSQGAQLESGTGPVVTLHYAEERLKASGVALTFLRAPYFLENWAPVVPVASQQGALPSFLPADFEMLSAATRDIGRIGADALLRPPSAGVRIVEIEGPAPVTPRRVAEALGRRLGREVKVVEAPLDAVVPAFMASGVSESAATAFREMYEAFLAGRMNPVGPPADRARGTTEIADALLG